MNRVLIKNARIVNEGAIFEGDLLIEDRFIKEIAESISAKPDVKVIDAEGNFLIPGAIDDQVHFREPGLEYKADMASESAAAVAGGLTSFMDMPNTSPPTLDSAALEDKYRRAAGRAWGNHGFYLGASNDNLEAIRALDPKTAPGVKVFMGASTGNMLVDDPDTLDGIVPSMILQPLVENAIKYAVARRVEGGSLRIEAQHEGEQLVLRVIDDGPGCDSLEGGELPAGESRPGPVAGAGRRRPLPVERGGRRHHHQPPGAARGPASRPRRCCTAARAWPTAWPTCTTPGAVACRSWRSLATTPPGTGAGAHHWTPTSQPWHATCRRGSERRRRRRTAGRSGRGRRRESRSEAAWPCR